MLDHEITKSLSHLHSVPLTRGRLLTNIRLNAGTSRVPHGLSRQPLGFLVVDKTENTDVWRDATDTDSLNLFLPLVSSVATTVSLWVF